MTTPQESIELLKDSIDQTTQQLAAKVIRLRVLHEQVVQRPINREPEEHRDTDSIPNR
jgi:hypothetical protein